MHVMKAVLALLVLTPMVLANPKVIISMSEASPVDSDSVTVTFLFSETVNDFDSDSVVLTGISLTDGADEDADLEDMQMEISESTGNPNYRRFTMEITDLTTGTEYTLMLPEGVATGCTLDDDECDADGEDSEESSTLSFQVYIGEVFTLLVPLNPSYVTTGTSDIAFELNFNHDVYPKDEDAIWAFDGYGNELDLRDITYTKTQWTYRIAAYNGGVVNTGVLRGAAEDLAGNDSAESLPPVITHTLIIYQDCVQRDVWSEWSYCNAYTGLQQRINYPELVQPAMFGGRDCNLLPYYEIEPCDYVDPAESCLSVFGGDRCSLIPTIFDSCDCTSGCLTYENGLGCCPDAGEVCDLGCARAGCDVLIKDVDDEVICACDYMCVEYGDCCSDFEDACSNGLCGTRLNEGVEVDDLCDDDWSDPNDVTCHCDHLCTEYGDCCSDYFRICDANTMCESVYLDLGQWSRCGSTFKDCACDILCPYYDDCCPDYGTTCAFNSDLEPIDSFLDFGSLDISDVFLDFENPDAPPESCDCESSGLGDSECCGSSVGYYGRRCGCAADCVSYNDCCDDYADVCA